MSYLVAILMLALPVTAIEDTDQFPTGPVVELSGTITRVQVVRGQGMPFLEVEHDGETARVHLGSMRYLLQHNFSPAAGEKVEIEAFRRNRNELVAKKVTLVKQNKTLALRDDDGRPLWQRGRYGRSEGQGQGRGKLEAEGKQ